MPTNKSKKDLETQMSELNKLVSIVADFDKKGSKLLEQVSKKETKLPTILEKNDTVKFVSSTPKNVIIDATKKVAKKQAKLFLVKKWNQFMFFCMRELYFG